MGARRGHRGQGRRHRLRPALRERVLRQAAAEVLLAYDIPVAIAAEPIPTQMTSYEVVERGAACGVMITASHNPWTGQRLQGQVADRRRGRPGHPGGRSSRSSATTPARSRRRGRSRTPRRPGKVERFDPYPGYVRVRRALARPRAPAGPPTCACSSSRCGARARAGSRGCWPAARSGSTEIHSERNPWFGGVNPEPIAPNINEALGILAERRLRPRAAARRRRGPRGRGRRAGHVHPPAPGHGPADVLPARAPRPAPAGRLDHQRDLDGRPARRALRRATSTRRRSASSTSGPKMIETGAMMGGEESGGYGFGMHLPERDGIYADLLLLDLFIREREARPLAGVGGGRSTSTRSPGRRSTCAPTSTSTAQTYPALKDRLLVELRRAGAGDARRASRSSGPTRCPPTTASSSGSTTARGCWSASAAPSRWCASTRRRPAPSCATRCWPRAAGWSTAA